MLAPPRHAYTPEGLPSETNCFSSKKLPISALISNRPIRHIRNAGLPSTLFYSIDCDVEEDYVWAD
jgi:hypothetical protein